MAPFSILQFGNFLEIIFIRKISRLAHISPEILINFF